MKSVLSEREKRGTPGTRSGLRDLGRVFALVGFSARSWNFVREDEPLNEGDSRKCGFQLNQTDLPPRGVDSATSKL